MESAGAIEDALGLAQRFGERVEDGGGEVEAVGRAGRADGAQGEERGFAADAAAGGGVEVALEIGEGDGDAGCKFDEDDVALGLVGQDLVRLRRRGDLPAQVGDGGDIRGVEEDAFGEEEAGDQFEVVARGAHGDGDGSGWCVRRRGRRSVSVRGVLRPRAGLRRSAVSRRRGG